MKTKLMIVLCVILMSQMVKAGSPFWYEQISNPSKTRDYIIGFYSSGYTISKASDDKEYVAYSGAIINKSSTELDWADYYMVVVKKDGTMVFNYVTASKSGEYSNTFTVAGNQTHYTKFCFHDVFKPEEIRDVYLFDKSNMKPFQLSYSENK